jgi:sn-glycerol 3-phosphate transport system permease protein
VWLGFFDTEFFGQNGVWIGLSQYLQVLTWETYQQSVIVTIKFASVTVIGSLLVSILIAYWIYRVDNLKTTYLTATIWPYAVPGAVAGTIALILLHPEIGQFTNIIEQVSGIEWNYERNPTQAFWLVSLATVWFTLGFNIIFLVAAFHSIPTSLNDVADLDGVPRWVRLYRVYLPLIAPTLLFLLVINTINGFFGGFAIIDLLTNGGPSGATNLMIFQLYESGFRDFDISLAAVQSVYLFIISVVLAVAQIVLSDNRVHYG